MRKTQWVDGWGSSTEEGGRAYVIEGIASKDIWKRLIYCDCGFHKYLIAIFYIRIFILSWGLWMAYVWRSEDIL